MKKISSDKLPPAPIYSRIVESRGAGTAYFSGVTGFGADGKIVEGGLQAEARALFASFDTQLGEIGASRSDVLKMNIFIKDMTPESLASFNEIYVEWVGEHRPARTAVGVVSLPRGQVEVDLTVELT
jgi:2-iminobutanoate/2-iminopropanoate deaminase